MEISRNLSLCKLTNRIKLNLLIFGNATVESGWHGSVVSPLFTRLYYITQGSFTIKGTDGKTHILQAGSWYLIPSGYSFTYECRETMEHFYFHIKVCDLDETDLLRGCAEPMCIDTIGFDSDFFSDCVSCNSFIKGIQLRNMLWEILLSFISKSNIYIDTEDYSPCIRNAILFIKNNLSMQLTVSQIAESCFVSKSTLTKHFKKELSTSINEYICDTILAEAELLLSTSNISILELSHKFGFSDQFYFSRKFKEKFGASPREYRKKILL